jgi:uncharacterized protein
MVEFNMTRRQLLKIGSGALALGVAAPMIRAAQPRDPELEYAVLGRTGLKVTTVSLGCMVAPEEVIAKAGDLGINWFDTANGYKGGRNEGEVGRALKGKRQQVYISTKLRKAGVQQMLADLDVSLQRLQTDYVDNLMVHALSSRQDVLEGDHLEALVRAKEAGKTRFLGFSTHSNMAECVDAAADSGFFDVLLVKFSYAASDPPLVAAVEKAAKAGIGLIAMKTQLGDFPNPGGTLTPHQAALKWVLDNPNITCAVPGTRDFQQLEQNVAVMGQRLAAWERRELERYAAETADLQCSGCGACQGLCPHGVEVADVRRCSMYLEGYRDPDLARESYRNLSVNAAPCVDCDTCVVPCTRGTALQPLMRDTHLHLA